MLNELKYPISLEYSSDGKFLPIEFYLQTIPGCKSIDLKLGYFSSNAIRALAYGFAQFIFNGGTLRIITNHFLSAEDRRILIEDPKQDYGEEDISKLLNEDLDGLAKVLEKGDQHFFNCLKYLHKHGRLIIQPVKTAKGGMSHYKQGLFYDGSHTVAFNGSCNFTYAGLIENGESFSISRSWGEVSEKAKIKEYQEGFEAIINKQNDAFQYLSVDEIVEVIKSKGQDKDLEQLIEDEIDVLNKLNDRPRFKDTYTKHIKDFERKVHEYKTKPRFPYPSGPRDYQQQAYNNWKANNYQGIFAMATGTGKTITSLNCLLEEYKNKASYNAIILVPTIALVDQWEEECYKFNFRNIIKVSGNQKWEPKLRNHLSKQALGGNASLIIITTYNSFVRARFSKYLDKFKADDLIIADEAHNMGSKTVLDALAYIKQQKRIGLSATVERQYDDFGNNKLREFFNSHPPYTFSYSMKVAIDNGVLCNYYYFPHIVTLNDIELEEYDKISRQLAKFYSSENDSYIKNEIVEILLLKRKRIIHKAQNKLSVFKKILREEYQNRGKLKNALVYVPEGDINEELHDDPDFHVNLLKEYTKVVRDVDKWITVAPYTSETKNRKSILEKFTNEEIQVLTSMKCLDEGVDIPQTELAFFCASTGNPKQFVQRRGRVLRQYEGKNYSVIHDLVVVPNMADEYENTYKMQQSIVKKELERVVNFSFLALNKYHTFKELDEVCKHYKLNLFTINDTLSDDKKR